MNDRIKNICVKYLMYDVNIEELETLENWLKESKNKQLFANFLKINYAIDVNINPFDTEKAIKEFLVRIRKNQRDSKKRKLIRTFGYTTAAIFAGVLATTYFFKDNLFNIPFEVTPTIITQDVILPGTNKATLTLNDGSQISLEKGKSFQTQNANSNGEQIVYDVEQQNSSEIVYNYLTIPRGGQYFVKLSDGTQVWLNSETQLKYPVNFVKGKTRQVELVYGEAYFDVSSSTIHGGAEFKVFNHSQEIEVLGTEFNIKAYRDESNIYTTLVEGNVVVSNNFFKQSLVPNEQSDLDIETNNFTVKEVNVDIETSWKRGTFRFVDKPLKSIMKVISRWYDVDVIFINKALESVQFIGVIDKQQSIDEVLSIMKSTSINDYVIKDKTLLLK